MWLRMTALAVRVVQFPFLRSLIECYTYHCSSVPLRPSDSDFGQNWMPGTGESPLHLIPRGPLGSWTTVNPHTTQPLKRSAQYNLLFSWLLKTWTLQNNNLVQWRLAKWTFGEMGRFQHQTFSDMLDFLHFGILVCSSSWSISLEKMKQN
jgi:hypothetical protein